MSSAEAHLMLKSKVSVLSYIGDVKIFDADGKLINSSGAWPLPAVSIAERAYFKTFKSRPAIDGHPHRTGPQLFHRQLDYGDRPQAERTETGFFSA